MLRKILGDIEGNISHLENRIKKHLFSMRSDFLHPYIGLKLRAYNQTLDFIEQNMPDAIVCNNRNEVFNYAISHLLIDGIIAEFGVKSGQTINQLAGKDKFRKKTIYGFDSFEGIPEDWHGTKTLKGQLSNLGKLPKVSKNVELIKGWFKESLPEFKKTHKENYAFIHIDCDLYQSTKDIFDNIKRKITKGTIIIFDEFFNYPNWKNHEHKAFMELVKEKKLKIKYLCYAHTQVAVLVK
jgi:hypothetical protein